MSDPLDEVSYNYEEDGKVVRKEIERAVLSKGAWATLMFLYQDMDRKTGEYQPAKIAIVRYKKMKGAYRKQSSFAISSERQARQVVEQIERWFGPPSAVSASNGVPASGEESETD